MTTDRVWCCDVCGKRSQWDKKTWRWYFLGGEIAVFCSEKCDNSVLDGPLRRPWPRPRNTAVGGAVLEGDDAL